MRVLICLLMCVLNFVTQVNAQQPEFFETKALAIHSAKQVVSDDYTFFINQVRTDGSLLTSTYPTFTNEFAHFVDEVEPKHIVTLYIDVFSASYNNKIYLIPDDKARTAFDDHKLEDYIDLEKDIITPILSKSPHALILFYDTISVDKQKLSAKAIEKTAIFFTPLQDKAGNRIPLRNIDLTWRLKDWPVNQFNQLSYKDGESYCIYLNRDGSCRLRNQTLAATPTPSSPPKPLSSPSKSKPSPKQTPSSSQESLPPQQPSTNENLISSNPPRFDKLAANCDQVKIDLGTLPLAVIELKVENQCVADEPYKVSLNGELYDGKLDSQGKGKMILFPLAVDNNVTVIFSDGSALQNIIPVKEARQIDRLLLSWQASENLTLYALKPGVPLGSGKEISGQTHCGFTDEHSRFDCLEASEHKYQVYTRSRRDKTKGKMIQFQVGYPCNGKQQNNVEFKAYLLSQNSLKDSLNSFDEQNCAQGTNNYFPLRLKIDLRKS